MAARLSSRPSCRHILRRGHLCLGRLDDGWQRESFGERDLDTPDGRLSFTSDSHQSHENDLVLLTKEQGLLCRAIAAVIAAMIPKGKWTGVRLDSRRYKT